MPVVNYQEYKEMLERAYEGHYAYPAFNVSNIETVNAVLKGLAAAKSDGIIQVSTGGGEHASGSDVKSAVLGAIALADYTRLMADYYNVNVALHTDHCKASKVESFLIPLIEETEKRRAEGRPNLFNSHMFDGSDVSLEENMEIAKKLLARCAKNEIILEVEAGVVGGEEDGNDNSGVKKEKLYTTPEDMLYVYNNLSEVEDGAFMFAATFGNVHGVYKPCNVQLNPGILKAGQDALKAEHPDAHFHLVFHGGSGSTKEEIHETLEYGVIKMNIDTDTQYAFTRPIVDHIMKNYDGVIKCDGEVGNKKVYDPRSYMKKAEAGMAERVVEACNDLKSAGKSARA
ncbi:MAG: class II fructose-bisphosphate aldolase [Oscillospiraceae bacterium]|nr:class II fructose-bisphosphate aldolase [Oscillospiraceae bacterium]